MSVKLTAMKSVHLILPDLFLPKQFAADISTDLALPALQKLLACGNVETLAAQSVEAALCAAFGVSAQNDLPIAAITARYDGLQAGYWLRADPVHLQLQRDQMLLSQTSLSSDEARQFCASLNDYFAQQNISFYAPHPQRWYVRVNSLPDMQSTPISEVINCNVRAALPRGKEAAHWHQVFNESQMLLHAHPLNEQREMCGEPTINSLWLWGAGDSQPLKNNYAYASSDEIMMEMFALAAATPYRKLNGQWQGQEGTQLLLCDGLRAALQTGDLQTWRDALQVLETGYAQPLLDALRTGKLARLQIDVLAGENSKRLHLTRTDTWRFWRYGKRLAAHSIV